MKLRDDLNAITPRLRRYARALVTGGAAPSELADDIVHATLMRALGARHLGGADDLVIRLYATVTQLNRETAVATPAMVATSGRPVLVADHVHFPAAAKQTKLSAGLLCLPLEEREALLLVSLEGFDHAEAARILRVSRNVLVGRLAQARKGLEAHLGAAAPATAKTGRSVPYLRLVT